MAPQQPMPEFSIVIPVYNSQGSLPLLHRRISSVMNKHASSWELILVNDCSTDGSWQALQKIAGSDANVTAINLRNNFGQHNTIMCGFRHASGKYIITMDDDLQHPPEEIPKLIKTIRQGPYHVVYGQYKTKNHGWFRDLCSKSVNSLLSKITGSGYGVTSFRALDGSVASDLTTCTSYNVMIDVLIKDTVASRYVGHCPVEHHPRTIGKSNYSFRKLFWYALNMIFNYTLWPLRVASILGFFFSFLSAALAVFFLIYYFLFGISVGGWTSLILSVTFFSGIILFVLGIIGEYVGRIFLNVSQKPQYVIKETSYGGTQKNVCKTD